MPPTYVVGDLWDELPRADVILVTTNATLNARNELVMGRGAALEAKQRFPRLPYWFGACLIERHVAGKLYGVMGIGYHDGSHALLGAFQVKYHWRDAARLEIVAFSAGQLTKIATTFSRIALNCPAVGNGRLAAADVLPILEPLPSHVIIYTKESL